MSLSAHLKELEKKHQALSDRIEEFQTEPGFDQVTVSELKRHKLRLKERITQVEAELAKRVEEEAPDARATGAMAPAEMVFQPHPGYGDDAAYGYGVKIE